MTIYELAKKAGVSIATISRAMTPGLRGKVAKKTLARIDALIKRSGYTPHTAARSMGAKKFNTIGMVLPHFSGIFFTDYYVQALSGLADALLNTDYRFKLIMLKSNQFIWDEENNLYVANSDVYNWDKYDFRSGEGVDALVVNQWPLFFSSASALKNLNIPYVTINEPVSTKGINNITCDNNKSGWLAAQHLADKGHRRIVVLTGPDWSHDSRLRVEGFKNYFKENVSDKYELFFLNGNYHGRMAAELTEHFLVQNKKKVTAFFCCNDLMAVGVLERLKKMGFDCPKDFSVIGCDDDVKAAYSDPPLTTTRSSVYDMTKTASRKMLEHLLSPESSQPFKLNQTQDVDLVVRKSCR